MTPTATLNIIYLVHDLSDPAVYKRTMMLRDGGAIVTLVGFHRTVEAVDTVAGCKAINLGQTYNGGFVQRLLSVVREVLCLGKLRTLFADTDLILARNLEMLAIGVRGKSLSANAPTLVYESLDIHRLLLNNGPIDKVLRGLEGWLSKRASALITSSPAFVSEYFNTRSQVRLPIRLIENKVYAPARDATPRPPGPPWRIGWFGAIRCKKSLALLERLVRQSNGSIEVIIRGRPALDQFEDFTKSTTTTPGLTFLGPYHNPDDLAAIYGEVHFTWAIDMFEEGLNSSWLLPNRLYEGGVYGSVPIALASVETGKFLQRLGIGITLPEPKEASLSTFFQQLTPAQYHSLEEVMMSIPQTTWRATPQDCTDLVHYLSALRK